MEGKLLSGGVNIMDKTTQQQKALEKQRQEMIEQKVHVCVIIIQVSFTESYSQMYAYNVIMFTCSCINSRTHSTCT